MRLYAYQTPRCPVLLRLRAHPIPIPVSSSLNIAVRPFCVLILVQLWWW